MSDIIEKAKVGKPLAFKSVEELQLKIDDYFKHCDENDKPYTICGLANHLGVTRQTLLNYQGKEEYFDTIKKSKNRCEQYAEEFLFSGRQVAGAIFNLKNNYGWHDEQKLNVVTRGINISISKMNELSEEDAEKIYKQVQANINDENNV
jgi:hypothetical protein